VIDLSQLPTLYSAWRSRYQDRDNRMGLIDQIVRGDFSSFDPDEERVESRSPNMIQVALEDTAEAAALIPTLRVIPGRTTEKAKRQASKMERVGASYLDACQQDVLINTTLLDLLGFGFASWVIWPDVDQRLPLIEKRDPRTCYPEPGHRPGEAVRRCMFARDVFFSQLPHHYQVILADFFEQNRSQWDFNTTVTLVEYYDEEELVVAALYEPESGYYGPSVGYTPVELERLSHGLKTCPVVVGSRFSLDGEFRGQFDQVISVMEAHVRLFGMLMDYADQAVYSDIWVRDLIGEMPFGGGAYIELGPNGAIGRVPPAVSSLNVSDDLQRLIDGIHMGARWPKQRPGEVDQAIASAKFVEATTGVMNTAIKTLHTIMRRMLEQSLRIAYQVDVKHFPGRKTASGILRNQEFLEEYDTADIDPKYRIRVEYGLGLGRDPAQSAVLHIQYAQAGFISQELVQENIDGVHDVSRERARIDVEKFRDMALARLLEGLQSGMIPDEALLNIAEDRLSGDDIFSLYRRYVVEPRKELEGQGLQGGLDPSQMLMPGMPGPDGAAQGIPGPAGPGAGPPGVPPAPAPPEILSRIGVPVPGMGLMGSQVTNQ
jgi:hypothetical protein